MSGNDYMKFMTQEIVKYMDMPQEERKKRRQENKSQRKQDTLSNRWFGLLPFAFKLLVKKKK
ncbi:YqzE family protein [Aquibacillus koreensis]|uniref:YqzE family protein n=1 Tax=Aquibacillus koreensis TaxID=279446 RepID=A0A9X4AI42_9BACI|nr:YqzE family protein [Aquibacillus koreensis]MCT2537544.1 YqzE family protein [Aquibacillus koreensis]MDC3418990.1 YqzE family protein [Aquibacillus koreensis]